MNEYEKRGIFLLKTIVTNYLNNNLIKIFKCKYAGLYKTRQQKNELWKNYHLATD